MRLDSNFCISAFSGMIEMPQGTYCVPSVSSLLTSLAMRKLIGVSLIVIFSGICAFACSCGNGDPIQPGDERFRDRAVFTARIVQLVGRPYRFDGVRYSSQALAVVHQRFWGLPWYWPKVVFLDGSYPCDAALRQDEEYLVSGRKGRYGVLLVNLCSRTQPLSTAQLDLRTIDPAYCSETGGTIIGHVYRGNDRLKENPPYPGAPITVRSQDGDTFTGRADNNGIYELRHLRPGSYSVESLIDGSLYASAYRAFVSEGHCSEVQVLVRDYAIRGHLAPGLGDNASIALVSGSGQEQRADR